MVVLFNITHEVGDLSDYANSPALIRDLYSGESYFSEVECLDITGFTGSRIAAMRDLRHLLRVDLVTAKSILNNLPYRLCETANEDEYHKQYRAAQQLRFVISESSYRAERVA